MGYLDMVVSKALLGDGIEIKTVGSERMNHVDVQDPESGAGLICSGLREKASVVRMG